MDPKSAAVMQLLSEKLKSGPDDQVVDLPEGGQLRLRRAPEPGISLIVEPLGAEVGFGSISWEAAATRPARYPEEVPFVPGRVTMLTQMPKGFHLQLFKVSEEDHRAVVAALVGSGWVETEIPSPTMPGMSIRPFRRGDRQRVLVLGGDLLGLIDTPAE